LGGHGEKKKQETIGKKKREALEKAKLDGFSNHEGNGIYNHLIWGFVYEPKGTERL
jgi:hypothetical protein